MNIIYTHLLPIVTVLLFLTLVGMIFYIINIKDNAMARETQLQDQISDQAGIITKMKNKNIGDRHELLSEIKELKKKLEESNLATNEVS